MSEILEPVIAIALEAGDAILEVYEDEDFGIETKADDSPLTRADLAAHRIILAGLAARFPDIPILSEESDHITFEERQGWQRYFLVDPLDGTKEFIHRNGEFTVNIALIDQGVPVLGVVHVPVRKQTYAGQQIDGRNAFVIRDGSRRDIRTRAVDRSRPLVVVASRRHGSDALQQCIEILKSAFDDIEMTNMGSSLKLCLVAEGRADLYPRLAPTSEWDTAAAQAVVEAAGGKVVDMRLAPLRYNTKDSILNPYFYVISDPSFSWEEILSTVEVS